MARYKSHYACFECKKTFKRRLLWDINRDDKRSIEAKCPQCGQLMANMGLDFASPKKDNLKEWAHIKNLYSVGITFHSCGCLGPGYIPKSTEKLIDYIEEIKASYFRNLEFWRNRIEPATKQEREKECNRNWIELSKVTSRYKKEVVKNQDGINYWLEKIRQVELKLEKIK